MTPSSAGVRANRLSALLLAWLAVAILIWPAAVGAEVPVPKLTGRVVDLAGVLGTGDREALSAKLAAVERERGAQVAVLVMPTLGGETIEDFATRVTDQWKLGRAGVDDGVLLLVSMQERRIRIQVGRGVEGALTDALSKRIIAEQMTPAFRAGDLIGGIGAGVDGILKAVAGEPLPPPKASARQRTGAEPPIDGLLAFALVFVAVAAMVLRRLFGRLLGAAGTGLLAGGGAAVIVGSTFAGIVVGVVAFVFALFANVMATRSWQGRNGGWHSGGGWGGGGGSWGGGGGGFSGGGGGFSGGGASGGW